MDLNKLESAAMGASQAVQRIAPFYADIGEKIADAVQRQASRKGEAAKDDTTIFANYLQAGDLCIERGDSVNDVVAALNDVFAQRGVNPNSVKTYTSTIKGGVLAHLWHEGSNGANGIAWGDLRKSDTFAAFRKSLKRAIQSDEESELDRISGLLRDHLKALAKVDGKRTITTALRELRTAADRLGVSLDRTSDESEPDVQPGDVQTRDGGIVRTAGSAAKH